MKTPSKQQLRRKYKISSEDFEILTDLPSEQEIRQKGFLVKVGEAFGVEEWMWKTWIGIILAIIIVAPELQSTVDYWKPKLVYSVSQFSNYFRHLRWPLEPTDDQWIAFIPEPTLPPPPTKAPSPPGLSVGSGLFPGPAQTAAGVPIQFVSQIRYHFRERWLHTRPGEKAVSAPAHETELLPLSELVTTEHSLGRVTTGNVAHLPYGFRVSVFFPDLTVEVYEGDNPVEGFPKTVQHSFTDHWDSRVGFMIPIEDRLKAKIESSFLAERCFLTYVNLVLGADDGLIGPAIFPSQTRA
jgi:hypothetical protein